MRIRAESFQHEESLPSGVKGGRVSPCAMFMVCCGFIIKLAPCSCMYAIAVELYCAEPEQQLWSDLLGLVGASLHTGLI